MSPNLWKYIGTGAAIVAGALANKVVNKGWESATGRSAPSDPTDPDIDWKEAVAFAAISGIVVGTMRLIAQRQTAGVYQRAVARQVADEGIDPKRA